MTETYSRDDDLAWARRWADMPSKAGLFGVLARLVLHIHEQDRSVTAEHRTPPDQRLLDRARRERAGKEVERRRADAAEAEVERLRAALRKISEWDMLNPPQTQVVSDLDWLRRLVDDALTAAGKDTPDE